MLKIIVIKSIALRQISGAAQYFFCVVIFVFANSTSAKGLYQTNDAFLTEVFSQQEYQSHTIWIKGEIKQTLIGIFDRQQLPLRQRYWRIGSRTAWIFNEIGKELPITIGVLIDDSRIKNISVLAYRESRGGEIRHDFFTRQFIGITVTQDKKLSAPVDGITGATLSVNAMKRVVAAALYLHKQVVMKADK